MEPICSPHLQGKSSTGGEQNLKRSILLQNAKGICTPLKLSDKSSPWSRNVQRLLIPCRLGDILSCVDGNSPAHARLSK